MTVTVFLSAAVLCFAGTCHNALVGPTTPIGSFIAVKAPTDAPGYAGSVAPFARDSSGAVFALHRTWTGNPAERREWRIKHGSAAQRRVTMGCINLEPQVYDALPDVMELEIVKKKEAK